MDFDAICWKTAFSVAFLTEAGGTHPAERCGVLCRVVLGMPGAWGEKGARLSEMATLMKSR